jgi:hypothetical protein
LIAAANLQPQTRKWHLVSVTLIDLANVRVDATMHAGQAALRALACSSW